MFLFVFVSFSNVLLQKYRIIGIWGNAEIKDARNSENVDNIITDKCQEIEESKGIEESSQGILFAPSSFNAFILRIVVFAIKCRAYSVRIFSSTNFFSHTVLHFLLTTPTTIALLAIYHYCRGRKFSKPSLIPCLSPE